MTGTKRVLLRELDQLCQRNKDGSFSTQAARKAILIQAGKQLIEAGFRNLGAGGLRTKHVQSLLDRWKNDELSSATIKNRIAHIRWWAEKINKQNVVPRSNAELGIEKRKYVTNVSKAVFIDEKKLAEIKDDRLKISIELQRAFGLRREECLKFQPQFAISGGEGFINLKASWCKGGRERQVPITNDYQKDVLKRALAIAGSGSMIPSSEKYIDRLKKYENAVNRAGLSRLHGLRHEYAQKRYLELTGWQAPACGGPKSRSLNDDQKKADFDARMKISAELGHGRESITAVYLGR